MLPAPSSAQDLSGKRRRGRRLERRLLTTFACTLHTNLPKGTLTLFLFARTIQNMINASVHNAGFFRPDHDPPQRSIANVSI